MMISRRGIWKLALVYRRGMGGLVGFAGVEVGQGEEGLVTNRLDEYYDMYRAIMRSGKDENVLEGARREELLSRRQRHSGLTEFLDVRKEAWFSENRRETPENYNKLIRVLGAQGKPVEALDVVRSMEEKGVLVSEFTLTALVKAAGDVGWTEGIAEVVKRLPGLQPDGPSRVLRTAIGSALIRCGQDQEAMEYIGAGEHRDLMGGGLYVGEAFRELERLPDDGDVVQFTALMKVYIGKKMYNHAWKVLEVMRIRGVEPDLVTFNVMISCAACTGDSARANSLVSEMRMLGHYPDIITYSSLANAYTQAKDVDGTRKTIGEAMNSGLRSDHDIFNVLLSACARLGDFRQAEQVLSYIKGRFGISETLLVSYSSLFTAYSRALYESNTLRRKKWYYDKNKKNDPADRGLASSGNSIDIHVRAVGALNELLKTPLVLATRTLNSYLMVKTAMGDPKRLAEALECLETLFRKRDSDPSDTRPCADHYTYAILIRACGEQLNPSEAMNLFNRMESDHGVVADEILLLQTARACTTGGLFDAALDLLLSARSRGIIFNVKTNPRTRSILCALGSHFIYADQRRISAVFRNALQDHHGIQLDELLPPKRPPSNTATPRPRRHNTWWA